MKENEKKSENVTLILSIFEKKRNHHWQVIIK